MLIQLIFLCVFLSLLFLLSQKISTLIYIIIYLITKSRGVAIGIISFLFLPGTIIHELAHFFIATMLRVPTGQLSIIPKLDKERNEIKAGHIMIAKTDPFRYTLIGIAPMLIGLALIYLVGSFLPSFQSTINNQQLTILIVVCYLFFVISNTMFSSRKDLESLIIVAPITFLILISLYKIGVRIVIEGSLIEKITPVLAQLNYYLGSSLIINFLVFIILALSKSGLEKMARRKLN